MYKLSMASLKQTMGTQRLEDPWFQVLCFNHVSLLTIDNSWESEFLQC